MNSREIQWLPPRPEASHGPVSILLEGIGIHRARPRIQAHSLETPMRTTICRWQAGNVHALEKRLTRTSCSA